MYERPLNYNAVVRGLVPEDVKARLRELAGIRGESAAVREAVERWIKAEERRQETETRGA